MVIAASRRRADIQGLRAIAVLSVVIYHASGGAWLTGGFVGVDIFFVISGFLITGILLKDLEEGRFSLVGFYRRRIRRIFPALGAVLLFTLIAGAFLLSPAAYRQLALTTGAALVFVSNVAFEHMSDYFARSAKDMPLLHTWSLAVEEQFYILFPMLLLLIWRLGRRAIGPILIFLTLVSLALSVWLTEAHPLSAFYLAPPRAFELLIGALIARYPGMLAGTPQRLRDGLSLLGLGLIAAAILLIKDTEGFPGAMALAPCLGAALVIAVGRDRPSVGGQLISSAPFRLFGDISYSLYLWHWPLLVLARGWAFEPLFSSVEVGVTLLSMPIAYASWRWIELPFLRGLPNIKVLAIGFAMIAGLGAISMAIVRTNGLPERFNPNSQAFFAAEQDYNPARSRCEGDARRRLSYDQNCVYGAPGASPSVAVWADSHGEELVVPLGQRLARIQGAVLQITESGCPPALGCARDSENSCVRHNRETVQHLAADARIRQVVLLANFGANPKDQRAELARGYEAAVRILTRAGKKVTLFEPIPTFAFDPPSALGLIVSRGGDPSRWGISEASYRRDNAPFLALIARVAKETGATTIPTAQLFCRNGLCAAYAKGEGVLYFNSQHVSLIGARRLAMAIPLDTPAPNTAARPAAIPAR